MYKVVWGLAACQVPDTRYKVQGTVIDYRALIQKISSSSIEHAHIHGLLKAPAGIKLQLIVEAPFFISYFLPTAA